MNEYEREAYEDKIDATRITCPSCGCLTYFEREDCQECGWDLREEVEEEEAQDPRPCPFCGGEAKALQKLSGAWVRCLDCPASMYEDGRTSDSRKLIELWNKRVSSREG